MEESLKDKLEKISCIFDIRKLQSVKADSNYIQRYYLKNKIPYSIFHNKENFVHMGISRDGFYKREDLLEHAKFIDAYIKNDAQHILELATGRGANSVWLAKKHPQRNFYGIDLSEGQISFAKKGSKKTTNFKAELGDFHTLSQFEDSSIDLVFVIEALCHSSSTKDVTDEVNRVLKPGGYFIIFDGYLGEEDLTQDEAIAAKITERGMAVDEFLKYSSLKEIVTNSGFNIVEEEDLSKYVIPTIRRFESLAVRFFKHPKIGRLLVKLLPREFTYNSVSGLLLPSLLNSGVFTYWVTVFKKDNTS